MTRNTGLCLFLNQTYVYSNDLPILRIQKEDEDKIKKRKERKKLIKQEKQYQSKIKQEAERFKFLNRKAIAFNEDRLKLRYVIKGYCNLVGYGLIC